MKRPVESIEKNLPVSTFMRTISSPISVSTILFTVFVIVTTATLDRKSPQAKSSPSPRPLSRGSQEPQSFGPSRPKFHREIERPKRPRQRAAEGRGNECEGVETSWWPCRRFPHDEPIRMRQADSRMQRGYTPMFLPLFHGNAPQWWISGIGMPPSICLIRSMKMERQGKSRRSD